MKAYFNIFMTTIYLVRHGITQANKENRFAGRTAEGLHPDGVEQIRQVGSRLHEKNIGGIFCGPLPRTVQSAEMATSLAGDHIDGTPKRALNPTCSIPPGTATPNYLTLLLLHSSSGHHCRIEFLTMGSPHGILSTQTGRPFFSHLR